MVRIRVGNPGGGAMTQKPIQIDDLASIDVIGIHTREVFDSTRLFLNQYTDRPAAISPSLGSLMADRIRSAFRAAQRTIGLANETSGCDLYDCIVISFARKNPEARAAGGCILCLTESDAVERTVRNQALTECGVFRSHDVDDAERRLRIPYDLVMVDMRTTNAVDFVVRNKSRPMVLMANAHVPADLAEHAFLELPLEIPIVKGLARRLAYMRNNPEAQTVQVGPRKNGH
jgi:hypothetical protein